MPNLEKQYDEALNYLYSFIDYSLTRNLRYSADKFDLSRMARFVDHIGNPQNDYPVIHIAGTKGKGSTGAMITNILTCAGYKTGFYTSPHMIEFTERMRIGSRQIPKKRLIELVEAIKPYVAREKELTTFEIMTALAFQYFSLEKVDFAVVEVGMGGRLDATNVVNPAISVITSISHDHMKVLGATLTQIAGEKAGIIKAGTPVVIAAQKKSVMEVFYRAAEEKKSQVLKTNDILQIAKIDSSLGGQRFKIIPVLPFVQEDLAGMLNNKTLFLPLMGNHQLENARTALVTVFELNRKGYVIGSAHIEKGLGTIEWPGRFELLSRDPLLIVDGAHNRDSFRKLKDTMDEYLRGKKKILLFGISEDKEVELMLKIIRPSVDTLVITRADHPRALAGEVIQKYAEKLGMQFIVTNKVEDGLDTALRICNSNTAIIASGSIFIAGAIKEIWNKRFARET